MTDIHAVKIFAHAYTMDQMNRFSIPIQIRLAREVHQKAYESVKLREPVIYYGSDSYEEAQIWIKHAAKAIKEVLKLPLLTPKEYDEKLQIYQKGTAWDQSYGWFYLQWWASSRFDPSNYPRTY